MLVLKRLPGQAVRIGEHVVVTVIGVDGGRVMLGIEAPRDVPVLRAELLNHPAPPNRKEPKP